MMREKPVSQGVSPIGEWGQETLHSLQKALQRVWSRIRQGLDDSEAARSAAFGFFYGLRGKLIVPYLLLTLLTAMVGIYVVTRLVTSSIRERFVNQMYEAGRVAADGIVLQEEEHLANLRLMTFTEGVPQAVANNDAERLLNLIWPLAINNEIDAVSVINLEGQEIMNLARDPNQDTYVVSHGTNLSRIDIVSKVLNGETDELGDKFAGLVQTKHGPFMFTSAPIYGDGNRLLGAMMIGTSLEELLSELKARALGDITVVDSNGQVFASTISEPPEGWDALLAGIGEQDQASTVDITLFGREYQALSAPLMIRQAPSGSMHVILPSNYIVSTISTSRNVFSMIFALGTASVILIGYLLAQNIARPILKLRTMSAAVAAGDLNQSSGLRRSDEIGDLANSFDIMTLRLRERTEEAAQLYAETVQRNKELAEINQRLQAAQAQLVQSEKLAAVGQLTAGIVHDVKNPLAVIKGLAEELEEDISDDPYAQEGLRTIRESAAKASTIVTDLLKFARQSDPMKVQQDLRDTINTSIRLTEYLARKGKIEVVTELPEESVMAVYDGQQIEQVLINLITNAIQAMPDGGTLVVVVKSEPEEALIQLRDNGIGIPPENLPRIFDPFFTTKPEGEGTGLGLSVGYGIISRHGGRINVESTEGVGTTFTISLPRTAGEPAGAEENRG
jgi:signal transduction histidine kinase